MKRILIALTLLFILPVYAYASQIGIMAPAFTLIGLDGNAITLEQFKGKVVFLDFWAPWCIPCKQELPELDKLYQKYGKEGFEVIGVCEDAPENVVKEFLRKAPVTFNILIDKSGDVADEYRISSLPIGLIIGRDGIIRHRHMGFGQEFLPMYEKEINVLLKQK